MSMSRPGWIERLRTRWKLKSAGQVVVVLIVFACTGFTVVYLKGPVLRLLAGDPPFSTTATILYYVLILPIIQYYFADIWIHIWSVPFFLGV